VADFTLILIQLVEIVVMITALMLGAVCFSRSPTA